MTVAREARVVSLNLACAILTEAGAAIGLGHLTRCVALYDAFESLGVACRMVIAGENATHVTGVRQATERDWRSPGAVLGLTAECDVAVIDSYAADSATYESIAPSVAVPVYLDDTARLMYPRGVLVNANPDACGIEFRMSPETTTLLGVRYQLLRAEFVHAKPRENGLLVRTVLVASGGSNAGGVLEVMVAAAKRAFPEARMDVVDSPRTAGEMRAAMEAADIALSAAGQTMYELAAMGVPAVAVCAAENQAAQAAAFERAGAAIIAGSWSDAHLEEQLVTALNQLKLQSARSTMSEAGQELVDGLGAERVAKHCVGLALRRRIDLRPATTGDENNLLALENESSVRSTAFQVAKIEPTEHAAWFAERLRDSETQMLLAYDGDALAGYVRFVLSGETAVVSIALAPPYRGLGLGTSILEAGITGLRSQHGWIRHVRAEVRADNVSSMRMFECAGFVRNDVGRGSDRVIYERML